MGLDELNQALVEQRTGGAPKDWLEIISKALDVPLPLLHRVFYAREVLHKNNNRQQPNWRELLPEMVIDAIRVTMEAGSLRLDIANSIRHGWPMTLPVGVLVPENDKLRLCRGCPEQFECIAEKLYTPEVCFKDRKKTLRVVPLRLTDTTVEVEAQQPQGRHTILLSKIP
jgi:hypothetical protein